MRTIPFVAVLVLFAPVSAGAVYATGTANIVASSCVSTTNKLRYDCTFTTDVETTVTVSWDDGTTARSVPRSEPGLAHDFRLVGMQAGVVVNWMARASSVVVTGGATATGSFTTSSLTGAERSALTVGVSGGHGVQSILFPADCSGGGGARNQTLFIADDTGAVIWYEDPSPVTGGGQIVALNFTDRRTILAIHGSDIVEYTLEGDLVTHLAAGVDFTNSVHHDVFRRDSRLFSLSSVTVNIGKGVTQQYDGVMVFDRTGLVQQWDSSALYDPAADCYDPNDCMHTNALWVGQDSSWTMSQRTAGRVVQVDGDPFSATYGQVVWELDGQGIDGNFSIASAVSTDLTFEGQHNIQILPDGELLLFDNEFDPYPAPGAGMGDPVRGLEIRLVGTTAVITAEYDTGRSGSACNSRGSAFKVKGSGGNVLTTCTDSNLIQEIDSTGTVLWEASTACSVGAVIDQPYRTIPIELP